MTMADPPTRPETAAHEVVAAGAPSHAAEHFLQRDRSLLERLQGILHRYETGSSLAVLLLAFVAFSLIAGEKFYDPGNISIITQQVMVVGAIAVAQSLVILTAGIDLSVGALMVFTSVVMGKLAVEVGWPTPLALLAGVFVGAACGLLNGFLVTRFKLPPFITTLGTLSIFQALNLYISESQTIGATTLEREAPMLQWMGKSFNIGDFNINTGVLLMIGLFVAMWFALTWTAWGRHVYAVGSDPGAARLAGIRTDRVLLSVYVIAGILCAIAAWISIGRNAVSPQANAEQLELLSITAVVIGGISLFGGRGSVFGALIGATIVGVFNSGLRLAGLDVLWVTFAIGVLIIVAVALDGWIRRVKA
jgi:fructose transport system permease protein